MYFVSYEVNVSFEKTHIDILSPNKVAVAT